MLQAGCSHRENYDTITVPVDLVEYLCYLMLYDFSVHSSIYEIMLHISQHTIQCAGGMHDTISSFFNTHVEIHDDNIILGHMEIFSGHL